MVKGEILYKNGDEFNGQIQNGKMSGQGLYKFKNGSFYEGQFQDNQFQGRGKLIDKLNDLTIVGEFKNGQPDGYSRVVYGDGSEYQGQLKRGLRHGKGLYKYAQNQPMEQYEGLFQEDSFEGFGQLWFRDKKKYRGDFKNNLFHGQGELITNQFAYIGTFVKGMIEGKGIMKFHNNEYYDGDFQLSKRHGYGKFHYSDGSQFTGSWKEDQRHGKGKIKKPNGDFFECEFQNDKRNGQISSKIQGYDIKAEMKEQKLHGPIKITNQDTIIQTSYKNGLKDGTILIQKQNHKGQMVTYSGQFKQGKENPILISTALIKLYQKMQLQRVSLISDVINIFKNTLKHKAMADMDCYKDVIPEFVFKLHHILEKNEYKEFITWANDGSEILIKNAKKLEDKVLPYFFRHKHLSSFIRQLNMYKFNKVNKISKERSHMYFKNDYFKRGEFQQMKLIKRSQRPKKGDNQNNSAQEDEHNLKEPSINSDLTSFKNESQNKFAQLQEILNRILKKHPALEGDMAPAIKICQNMKGDSVPMLAMGGNSLNNLFPEAEIEEEAHKNMLGNTVRDFPPVMNSMIYPSLCSLTNLDV